MTAAQAPARGSALRRVAAAGVGIVGALLVTELLLTVLGAAPPPVTTRLLENLDDPSTLGPAMAVAFLTTLWGAFIANYFFQPIAARLKKLAADEMASKELILEGILSIQAGSNPRAVAGKLVSFLPPGDRDAVLESDKKSA